MTGEDHSRRRLTYIGKRITASGRLVGFLGSTRRAPSTAYRKALGPAAPGARYDVAVGTDGSVLLGGDDAPRYVGRPLRRHQRPQLGVGARPEDERVLEWSARARAAQGMHAQAARAGAMGGPTPWRWPCRPLRQLYAAERTAVGRAVLLAALIEQITRPLSRSSDGRAIR